MRNLKYAILGLLIDTQMTGYDIAKEFSQALNEFWSAKHSQIYPELKKLEQEGLVSFKIEISGEILEKKVYTITEKGKTDFLSWMKKKSELSSTPKDIFRLKMYFAHNINKNELLVLIEDQKNKHQKRLDYLTLSFAQYNAIPKTGTPDFGDYLVLEGAVMREEMTIAWLNNCLGHLMNE